MAPKRVLFVCMGNICRSPAAHGVFQKLVETRGVADGYEIDSAGTIGYHAGELPDARMRAAAARRGYVLDHPARKVTPRDLEQFDMILAMDRDNLFHLHALDRDGRHEDRIRLFTEFHPDGGVKEVSDPYYGGPEGFEHVLDLVEKCSEGLLAYLEERRG